MRNFDYTVIELLNQAMRNTKAHPLNLGGFSGTGGGVGGPPGGFIGWLPQTRVAYDEDEIAWSGTSVSGSILDNLNHIRYRLDAVESGGGGILVVDELDGVPTVSGVTRITFSGGAIVTDMGSGRVVVGITASGGSGGGIEEAPIDSEIYGRQNAAWTPLDDVYLRLDVASPQQLSNKLDIISQTISSLALYHQILPAGTITEPSLVITRTSVSDPTGTVFTDGSYAVRVNDNAAITYSGGTLKHTAPAGIIVDINPYAPVAGSMVSFDSINAITASGRLLSLKNQTVEKFAVDGNGGVNIPTGQTYNINGVAHKHSRWLPWGIYTNFNPLTTTNQQPYSTSLDRTVTFTSWHQEVFVNGTNDGSNYWKIQINRASDGAVCSEVSTQSLSGLALLHLSTTTFSIASVGTADHSLYMYVKKTGSPGNLYMFGPMTEVTY